MLVKNKHINEIPSIRRKIASTFLLYYSLFIVFAAFHNHIINFHSNTTAQVEQTKASEKVFDPFLDKNSVCQLVQFSTTKISIDHKLDLILPPLQKIDVAQPIYSNHYASKYFFNIDLRAPPSNS